MAIVNFSFLGLYGLAYIRPHLVHVIYSFIIYKDSNLSSKLNIKKSLNIYFFLEHSMEIKLVNATNSNIGFHYSHY